MAIALSENNQKTDLNKLKILMRKTAKREKIRKITKLVRKIKENKTSIDKSKLEDYLKSLKILKTLKPDQISEYVFKKLSVPNVVHEKLIRDEGNQMDKFTKDTILLDELSKGSLIQSDIAVFISHHPNDWKEILSLSLIMSKHKKKLLKRRDKLPNIEVDRKSQVNVKATNLSSSTKSTRKIDPSKNGDDSNNNDNTPDTNGSFGTDILLNVQLNKNVCIKPLNIKSLQEEGCEEIKLPTIDNACNVSEKEIVMGSDNFFVSQNELRNDSEAKGVECGTKSYPYKGKNLRNTTSKTQFSTSFVQSLAHTPKAKTKQPTSSQNKRHHDSGKNIPNNKTEDKRLIEKKGYNLTRNVRPKENILKGDVRQPMPIFKSNILDIHPSWVAKKNLSKQLATQSANSKKIVFSDSE